MSGKTEISQRSQRPPPGSLIDKIRKNNLIKNNKFKYTSDNYSNIYLSISKFLIKKLLPQFLLNRIKMFLLRDLYPDYQEWVKTQKLTKQDSENIKNGIAGITKPPLISIIMPVYNSPERYLIAAIESVEKQLYPYWELCIVDDASTNKYIKSILDQKADSDPRIKVRFRKTNGHISIASNEALAMAKGKFVGFLDHDDQLSITALYYIVKNILKNPNVSLIYSDEDKIKENGEKCHPYFKPDWNPELFLSQNYFCHFMVCRTSVVHQVKGFESGLEGAQDWDLAMRITEIIPPEQICHIPKILYHWRICKGSTALSLGEKDYINSASYQVIKNHFERSKKSVSIELDEHDQWRVNFIIGRSCPRVSIIIPTRNMNKMLRKCVESIQSNTNYDNYEIIIVDNNSTEKQTQKYLKNIERRNKRIKVLRYEEKFNFSAINNFAVKSTSSDIIGLLNNDTRVISQNWLEELVSLARRKETGAVGAMLYYPNNTIQHAGIVTGVGGVAAHTYKRSPRGYPGNMRQLLVRRNVSAVTGACLFVRRELYDKIGGLDENNLPIAFNDVDFCLKLIDLNYYNLWTPYVELYHYESISRGYEDTEQKKERFRGEVNYMMKKWDKYMSHDFSYNVNLNKKTEIPYLR